MIHICTNWSPHFLKPFKLRFKRTQNMPELYRCLFLFLTQDWLYSVLQIDFSKLEISLKRSVLLVGKSVKVIQLLTIGPISAGQAKGVCYCTQGKFGSSQNQFILWLKLASHFLLDSLVSPFYFQSDCILHGALSKSCKKKEILSCLPFLRIGKPSIMFVTEFSYFSLLLLFWATWIHTLRFICSPLAKSREVPHVWGERRKDLFKGSSEKINQSLLCTPL